MAIWSINTVNMLCSFQCFSELIHKLFRLFGNIFLYGRVSYFLWHFIIDAEFSERPYPLKKHLGFWSLYSLPHDIPAWAAGGYQKTSIYVHGEI